MGNDALSQERLPDALQFIVNRISKVRHETVDGRDYLVAPVVAICEGVLNGELVKAEEIAAHIGAWGGRPFTVGHPADAGGARISAGGTPAIRSQWSIGEFYPLATDAFTGGKLRGEAWVDVARATGKGGDALEVLRRLEAGTPVEVSTAYFRDREEKAGEFNGDAYDGIAHNLRPDHLAALLHIEGACSWADGCGTPRVNQGEGIMAEGDEGNTEPQENDAGLIKRFVTALTRALGTNQTEERMRNKILEDGRLSLTEDQLTALPDDVVENLAASLEAMPVVNADQGNEPPVDNEDDPAQDQAEDLGEPIDIKAVIGAAFSEFFGGLSGEDVRALLSTLKINEDSEKATLVAELAANEQCAFDKTQLEAMGVGMLQAAKRSFVTADYSGQGGGMRTDPNELTPLPVPKLFAKES